MPCRHVRVWVPVPMFLHARRNLPSRGRHLQLFQWLDGRGLWNEYVQFLTKAWWLVQTEGRVGVCVCGGGGGVELGQVHYQSSLLLWLLLVNKSEFLLLFVIKPESVPPFHICFPTYCNGRECWCFRLPAWRVGTQLPESLRLRPCSFLWHQHRSLQVWHWVHRIALQPQ